MRRRGVPTRRRIFKCRNSIVVSLPRAFLDFLNLEERSVVSVCLDKQRRVIVVAPMGMALLGVDAEFGRQVAEFIEQYRPALQGLASGRADDP